MSYLCMALFQNSGALLTLRFGPGEAVTEHCFEFSSFMSVVSAGKHFLYPEKVRSILKISI